MHDARFFQSTRGKIVAVLRRRRGASAVELAEELGLSANAIRQQLLFLERDNYVEERPVRRGPTKPTHQYSLTKHADTLFPQSYDRMLRAVLRGVREELGEGALNEVLDRLGERAAERFARKAEGKVGRERIEAIAAALRESGVDADVVETVGGGVELIEHACPYSLAIEEHPELCRVIHTALRESVPGGATQIESLATGGDACRFEISLIEKVESLA